MIERAARLRATPARTGSTSATVSGRGIEWARVVLLVAALAAQLYLLYAPLGEGPSPFPNADKIVHAGLFGLPTMLALLPGCRPWRWLVLVLAMHAPVSELIQGSTLVGRDADVWDVVADITGIGCAIGLCVVWKARRSR